MQHQYLLVDLYRLVYTIEPFLVEFFPAGKQKHQSWSFKKIYSSSVETSLIPNISHITSLNSNSQKKKAMILVPKLSLKFRIYQLDQINT